MYDTGDPGPPCWKDAPQDEGGEKEEDADGKKGGWEGAEEERHWLLGGCPG